MPTDWNATLSLIPGYNPRRQADGFFFDDAAADYAVDFFDGYLTHIEGAMIGKPFKLEPWQRAVVGCIFGWKIRATGMRRYREVLLYVPRKNGKTPLAAGISILVLLCDPEAGAQNYLAAADRDQAALVYRHAKGMVENNDELRPMVQVYGGMGHRSIVYPAAESFLKVISSDAQTKHGGNPHLVIVDELHAQPNRELVDVLQSAMISKNRPQPLTIYLTTADFYRPSICNEKYDYACKVRDGIIDDPAFLPVVYSAAKDCDWKSEKVWEAVNPNLDVSVSREFLRRECGKAQEIPSYENTFKRLYLNVQTEQDSRWITMADWDACSDTATFNENEIRMEGRACYGGLDLASTRDIAAFVLYFPDDGVVLPYFWVPADNAEKRELVDKVPYRSWGNRGFIQLTAGNDLDYNAVREKIKRLAGRYRIQQVGFDPWNAHEISHHLNDEDGVPMLKFSQSFATMNEPCHKFEMLLRGRRLDHGGHEVLRWMASNVAIKTHSATGNIRPDKQKSTEKIDGIVALVMAVGCSMFKKEEEKAYDERKEFVVL